MRVLAAAAMALAGLAAQPSRSGFAEPQPRAMLDSDQGWLAGTIQAQLDRDGRLIPYGKGAIFVPSMTHGLDEPPVTVWRDNEKIAEETTGKRIVLSPGVYRVRMGSGTVEQRFGMEVSVRELHTTVVPVFWSGLSVHVVDNRLNSLRGAYELIRVDTRDYVGVGFGAREQEGEPVSTWILRPGLYKIVRVGETYRARTDFATVRLEEGRLTHFLLVMNVDTGDFEGGGEVPVEELFLGGGFGKNLLIGGDLGLNSNRNVPETEDGEDISFKAFIDGSIGYYRDAHRFSTRLQVEEEGRVNLPEEPLHKSRDRAKLDVLYIYDFLEWLGPYVSLGAETNLLPFTKRYEDPSVVTIRDATGDNVLRTLPGVSSLELSPSIGLLQLKQGAGANVRLLKTVPVEIQARVGVGARQQIARDLLEEIDDTTFREIPSTSVVGVEGTLVGTARLTRWVLLNAELETLIPFDDPESYILDLEGRVSFKLTQYVSVDYSLRYLNNPAISDKIRLEQALRLRFSIDVL